MQNSMYKSIQRNLRTVLRRYKEAQHQDGEAQPGITDDVFDAKVACRQDDREEATVQKVDFGEELVDGELNEGFRPKSKTSSDTVEMQRHGMYAPGQESAGEQELAAENRDYLDQKRVPEQGPNGEEWRLVEQKGPIESKDFAHNTDSKEQKDSTEQDNSAEDNYGTEASSAESSEDFESNLSVTIKFCPTGELAFVASMITVHGLSIQANDSRIVSLVVSIIRTDTGQRKVTGELGLAVIGVPTKESVVIEYNPVHKVLAYSISLLYHQKTKDGSFWRRSKLFLCRLSQPTVIADSEHDGFQLRSKVFDLGKAPAS